MHDIVEKCQKIDEYVNGISDDVKAIKKIISECKKKAENLTNIESFCLGSIKKCLCSFILCVVIALIFIITVFFMFNSSIVCIRFCYLIVILSVIVCVSLPICLTICIVQMLHTVSKCKESDNAEKAFERLDKAYGNIK